ncbi:NmrA family NAD(P)-binding protein [Streptomyces sp. NPDC004623]|uniref:NmrA family NAD(P)-binding protein n=1 Tax=Streptomyces sp. NPDC004623 TaxID=3156653 RepID=UPI0033A1FF0D
MSTIAVTGATGNLGGLVIDHLIASKVPAADVIPLVRSAQKGEAFAARGMAPRVATYDDPEGFARAIEGVDKLVLISPPELDNAKRLHQLHGAVMAARGAGLEQLALVSLADPEERPFGLEDVDLAIEYSIRAAGIPFTFLRNSVYLDELAGELAVAAATGELLSATDNHTMNWAPRGDMAAAIASAVMQDGHIGATYNLVSPEPYTYDDLAAQLSEATGRPVTHRVAPDSEVVAALIAGGMGQEHAESMVRDFQGAIAAGKCRTTGDDIEHLSGRSGRPTPHYLKALTERHTPAH